MIRVDELPSRFDNDITNRLALRRQDCERAGGRIDDVHVYQVHQSIGELISRLRDFLTSAGASIVLDISSMPKRVFFPIMKILRRDPRVADLFVSYTVPESYPNVAIAADFQEWQHLPLFAGPSSAYQAEVVVVGVGFMAMRLREELNAGPRALPLSLIFPFPPGPPAFHRSWDMVRVLEEAQTRPNTEIRRVDAKDASDTFDHLLAISDNGKKPMILAPFGPKPVSLAMCLFADRADMPVYYTQPRAYHPDYSLGIAHVENEPQIFGYVVKLRGNDWYDL